MYGMFIEHCGVKGLSILVSGGDIYTLSRLLGHSSVTVTEQAYLDVNQDDLAEMYRKHSPLSKII